MVVVFDESGRGYLYVDGSYATSNYANSARSALFRSGRWKVGDVYGFSGSIDDVNVFDYALTADQVAQRYAQKSA
jgi:hypothetical protein